MIKNLILTAALFFALIQVNAFGTHEKKQSFYKPLTEQPRKSELIVFPLSFIVSGIEVGGEFVVQPKRTFRISGGYFTSFKANSYNTFSSFNPGNNRAIEYSDLEGFRTELQYRFYSRDFEAPDNFYLGIFSVFKMLNMRGEITDWDQIGGGTNIVEPINISSSALSLGFVLGYRIRIQEFLSADFHFGGGMTPTSIGDAEIAHIDQLNPYRKSINLKAGVTFGLRL